MRAFEKGEKHKMKERKRKKRVETKNAFSSVIV